MNNVDEWRMDLRAENVSITNTHNKDLVFNLVHSLNSVAQINFTIDHHQVIGLLCYKKTREMKTVMWNCMTEGVQEHTVKMKKKNKNQRTQQLCTNTEHNKIKKKLYIKRSWAWDIFMWWMKYICFRFWLTVTTRKVFSRFHFISLSSSKCYGSTCRQQVVILYLQAKQSPWLCQWRPTHEHNELWKRHVNVVTMTMMMIHHILSQKCTLC